MAKLNLKKRDIILIAAGMVVLALIAVIQARAFAQEYDRAKSNLELAARNLEEAREMRFYIEEERAGQRAVNKQIRARRAYGDLFSFMNRTLRSLDLVNRGTLANAPQRGTSLEGVKLTLRGVSMEELVNLLHDVHASKNLVAVSSLNFLRPARDGKGLDCEMIFVAPRG